MIKLKKLEHECLLPLQKISQDEEYKVTKDIPGYSRNFEILTTQKNITEKQISLIIRGILEGIEYLHSKDIIHGILRPEFIHINEEDFSVKLSEYGIWKIIGTNSIISDNQGNRMYLAPETLKNIGFGKPVDLWSVGIITYLLLSGSPPFYGNSFENINESIINCSFDYSNEHGWECISNNAIDFIDSLLVSSPNLRMNVVQALDHPFITNPSDNIIPDLPEKIGDAMNLYQHKFVFAK